MLNDSGNRTKYKSRAVRDMKQGKGRCDLLPLGVIYQLINKYDFYEDKVNLVQEKRTLLKDILFCFGSFQKNNNIDDLLYCLYVTIKRGMFENFENMLLELSVHFEEGAEKYGIDNWKKGIPEWSYIDSAIRHLLKWARGDNDERHDRAFVWNIVCLIWTVENKEDKDE